MWMSCEAQLVVLLSLPLHACDRACGALVTRQVGGVGERSTALAHITPHFAHRRLSAEQPIASARHRRSLPLLPPAAAAASSSSSRPPASHAASASSAHVPSALSPTTAPSRTGRTSTPRWPHLAVDASAHARAWRTSSPSRAHSPPHRTGTGHPHATERAVGASGERRRKEGSWGKGRRWQWRPADGLASGRGGGGGGRRRESRGGMGRVGRWSGG